MDLRDKPEMQASVFILLLLQKWIALGGLRKYPWMKKFRSEESKTTVHKEEIMMFFKIFLLLFHLQFVHINVKGSFHF